MRSLQIQTAAGQETGCLSWIVRKNSVPMEVPFLLKDFLTVLVGRD